MPDCSRLIAPDCTQRCHLALRCQLWLHHIARQGGPDLRARTTSEAATSSSVGQSGLPARAAGTPGIAAVLKRPRPALSAGRLSQPELSPVPCLGKPTTQIRSAQATAPVPTGEAARAARSRAVAPTVRLAQKRRSVQQNFDRFISPPSELSAARVAAAAAAAAHVPTGVVVEPDDAPVHAPGDRDEESLEAFWDRMVEQHHGVPQVAAQPAPSASSTAQDSDAAIMALPESSISNMLACAERGAAADVARGAARTADGHADSAQAPSGPTIAVAACRVYVRQDAQGAKITAAQGIARIQGEDVLFSRLDLLGL